MHLYPSVFPLFTAPNITYTYGSHPSGTCSVTQGFFCLQIILLSSFKTNASECQHPEAPTELGNKLHSRIVNLFQIGPTESFLILLRWYDRGRRAVAQLYITAALTVGFRNKFDSFVRPPPSGTSARLGSGTFKLVGRTARRLRARVPKAADTTRTSARYPRRQPLCQASVC